MYEKSEMSASHSAASPVNGVKYTLTINDGGAAENGQVNLNISMTQSLDDDNPLYASSALEKILSPRESNGARNANGILQEELTHRVANGHTRSSSEVSAIPLHSIAKISTLHESRGLEHILVTADIKDPTQNPNVPQQSSGPPPVPMKPKRQPLTHQKSSDCLSHTDGSVPVELAMTSSLAASQSLDNLLKSSGGHLNPYGEYSDKTLQRVISGHSMDEAGAEGNGMMTKNDQSMFDSPEYESVRVEVGKGSKRPMDIDYEEI